MKTQVLAAFAAVCFCAPAAALAAPVRTDIEQTRVVVRYDDLNTATTAGRAAVERRIKHAASEVCGPAPTGPGRLMGWVEYKACQNKALTDALAQLPPTVRMAGN
jgi:UrcA family protein